MNEQCVSKKLSIRDCCSALVQRKWNVIPRWLSMRGTFIPFLFSIKTVYTPYEDCHYTLALLKGNDIQRRLSIRETSDTNCSSNEGCHSTLAQNPRNAMHLFVLSSREKIILLLTQCILRVDSIMWAFLSGNWKILDIIPPIQSQRRVPLCSRRRGMIFSLCCRILERAWIKITWLFARGYICVCKTCNLWEAAWFVCKKQTTVKVHRAMVQI